MTTWVVATLALSVLFALGGVAVLRGGTLARVVGLQLAGVMAPLLAVTAAVATGRGLYLEIGLALAVLSLAGALAYARFLERWL